MSKPQPPSGPGGTQSTPAHSPGFHVHQERAEEAVLYADGEPSGTGRVVFCGSHVLRIEFDPPAVEVTPTPFKRGGRPGKPTTEGGVWGSYVDYVKELEARVADYEESINWDTTCLACAKRLTREYGDLVASNPTPVTEEELEMYPEPVREELAGLPISRALPTMRTVRGGNRFPGAESASGKRRDEDGQDPGEQASGDEVDPADHAEGGGPEAGGGEHEQHDDENVHANRMPAGPPDHAPLRWCRNCQARIYQAAAFGSLLQERLWWHFDGARKCATKGPGFFAKP